MGSQKINLVRNVNWLKNTKSQNQNRKSKRFNPNVSIHGALASFLNVLDCNVWIFFFDFVILYFSASSHF
jgi:hypothetical protein